MDEEDEYNLSDDTFDFLADQTLQQLEQNAILSTQQVPGQSKKPSREIQHHPKPTHHVATISGPVVQAQTSRPHPVTAGPQHQPVSDAAFEDDSFDFEGDQGVPTPVEEKEAFLPHQNPPGDMTQREQWRKERFGRSAMQGRPLLQQNKPQKSITRTTAAQQQVDDSAYYDDMLEDSMMLDDSSTVQTRQNHPQKEDGLLARIDELLRERDRLTAELQSTKAKVMTQQGEIAIIRENKQKESKVYDRQLSTLKKSMQEESAKQQAAILALTEKTEKVATDNRFLKHELAEETEKLKTMHLRLKEKPGQETNNDPKSTPKRGPAVSLRDGFDDDEIMIYSPSRSARRSKPSTPTAANKRKRRADVQSPIRPLVLRASDNPAEPSLAGSATVPQLAAQKAERIVPIVRRDLRAERNLQFVQSILNYQVKSAGDRLIETLIKFSLPSEPSNTFSSVILSATACLKGPRLPADLLQVFVELWVKSLREKYYEPIGLLIEVVDYIVDVNMEVLDKGTINILLPVLQESARINGVTRFKHSPVNQSTFGQFRQTPQTALNHKVSGTECMKLLFKIACVVGDEFPLIDLFWRSMSTDFVLMMLNSWQPVSDITLMFHLLATSIFPSTFGCVCEDDQQQAKMETFIIDRVCYLLWETPKVDEEVQALTRAEICNLRIEAMKLLLTLAVDSSLPPYDDPDHHGSQLLAKHPSAIARIVRSLYDEVAAMYLMTSSHALHAELVNHGVRLLFHVLRLHEDKIDMQKKLSVVNGGVNKHRVVLTRLAFSEGVYIDRLITDETVAMATSMLEESVTPDEADQLIEAFPNFRGRRVAATAAE